MPHRRGEPGAALEPALRWTAPYDALLRALGQAFALLPCTTPANAADEQRALLRRWRAGEPASPAWRPAPIDRLALAQARVALDRARATLDDPSPWAALYAARLEELARELALIDAAFGPRVVLAARARWGAPAPEALRAASTWIERGAREARDAAGPAGTEPEIPTDDERDPRSLVSSLRRAIGASRAPVRVLVRDRIGALAASGDGIVVVAQGRTASPREVARVTLHEVEGHVLPRERARTQAPGLCALGSAGASEDEEGRALLLEDRAGLLAGRRRRALGLRHVAAAQVLEGASFVELVRALIREHDEPLEDALRLAARTMRGAHVASGDAHGGVAREIIYLPGYLRVAQAVEREPAVLARLGGARLSLAAHRTVRRRAG